MYVYTYIYTYTTTLWVIWRLRGRRGQQWATVVIVVLTMPVDLPVDLHVDLHFRVALSICMSICMSICISICMPICIANLHCRFAGYSLPFQDAPRRPLEPPKNQEAPSEAQGFQGLSHHDFSLILAQSSSWSW